MKPSAAEFLGIRTPGPERGCVFFAEFFYHETVNPFRDGCVLKPEMVNPFLGWIEFFLSREEEGRGQVVGL